MRKKTTMKKRLLDLGADQSGTVVLITAMFIFVLLGCGALALDIGHIVMVKSQLEKAADAGALAGARGLWPEVLPITADDPMTPNYDNAINMATSAASQNAVDGRNLASAEITVQVGQWDYTNRSFIPGFTSDSNSVRVTTHRDGIVMFFAQVFGIGTRNLSATSTAVMDYASCVGKGSLPIVLDDSQVCNADGSVKAGKPITIHMTPDTTDNGGWFVVSPDAAAAATLKDYINDYSCPSLWKGKDINLQNGADASVISAIKDQFVSHKGNWVVVLPTVTSPKYNQVQPVVRFVGLMITKVVKTTSDKRVEGRLITLCEISNGMPGGDKGGALAPPKLVQ
jgi:Flp pilus assembly protein TadG